MSEAVGHAGIQKSLFSRKFLICCFHTFVFSLSSVIVNFPYSLKLCPGFWKDLFQGTAGKVGEVRETCLLLSATSTRSRSFRHYDYLFFLVAAHYHTAFRWDLSTYRFTNIILDLITTMSHQGDFNNTLVSYISIYLTFHQTINILSGKLPSNFYLLFSDEFEMLVDRDVFKTLPNI